MPDALHARYFHARLIAYPIIKQFYSKQVFFSAQELN